MPVYPLIIIWYIFLALCHNLTIKTYGKQLCDKLFTILFFPFCGIIMGLRSTSVGADTATYANIFQRISDLSFWEIISVIDLETEVGYALFMKLSYTIYPDYYFFQLLCSILYCGISGFIAYRYSRDTVLFGAIFLGIGTWLLAFNITRQMFAGAIITIAIFELMNQKYLKCVCLFLAAIFTHTSSIFIPFLSSMYFLYRKNWVIILIASTIIALAVTSISLVGYFDTVIVGHYANYLENSLTKHEANGAKILWLIITILSILILIKPMSTSNRQLKFIATLAILFPIFSWIGLSFNYAERIGCYFIFLSILVFTLSEFSTRWLNY